jgi:general secretion pathway protein J
VNNSEGFTLVELLVALAIFVILSALCYRSLEALLQTRERISLETRKWREVMLFFNRLDSDMHQVVNRPIRVDQAIQPCFLGKPNLESSDDAQLSFSRLGDAYQSGVLMDTQRISYRFIAGRVEMLVWPALDIESSTKPAVYTVLNGVKAMSLRFKPTPSEGWVDAWPVSRTGNTPVIPKALEVSLTLASGEILQRVYNLQ